MGPQLLLVTYQPNGNDRSHVKDNTALKKSDPLLHHYATYIVFTASKTSKTLL